MIDRKAALLACREGQWIRTAGMKNLIIDANIPPETELIVYQLMESGEAEPVWILTAGKVKLPDAEWTRVVVAHGPHMNVLCVLESSKAEVD